MQLFSDEWLDALDEAARRAELDPLLADVRLSIEQRIEDGPTWRVVIDHGQLRVLRPTGQEEPADIRFTASRAVATEMATGRRSALDAFIAGELRVGGDVQVLLDRRAALEAVGDVFATVVATEVS